MASAGTLIFELAADVSRLRADMGKAQAEIMRSLDSIAKASAATAMLTGAQFAASFARGFADKIKAAIDQADALGKLAQRIGTSTEALSGLSYAAEFAGVSLDDLTTGFKGLNKAMLDARDPTSDARAAFDALGLDWQKLKAMDPAAAFSTLATAFSGFKDGAEKAAVATALFGKEGQKLIPLLNEGADGIKEATDEAEKMGLVVSQDTADAMGKLNDDLARMQKQSEGMAAVLAKDLQPTLSELVNVMRDASTEGTPMNDVLHAIGVTAQKTVGVILAAVGALQSLAVTFKTLWKMAFVDLSAEGGWEKMKQTWAEGNAQVQSINEKYEASVTKIMHVQTEAEKTQNASAAALGRLGKATDDAGKKTLNFSGTLDANKAAAERAKKQVDEYAKMLENLQENLRKVQAEGDPLKELQTDPKFLAMTKQQQETLKETLRLTLELQQMQALHKQEQADIDKGYEQSANDLANYNKQLQDFTSSNLDSLNPLRQQYREMAMLNDALERTIINQDEYNQLVAQSEQKTRDAFANMSKAAQKLPPDIKVLKDAIEGFGKQASDAFVNFIFATKDASTSFSEMVASILKDLAKMLVYQNIMQPLFSTISGGITGGGWNWAGFFQGGRMGGGPVSAGRMYEVNEIPGRKEYFLPNVPGRITTDAGAANGGGPNVVVNVHMAKDDTATQATTANERQAAELGNRIATVVRQVITVEKRSGGLLAPSR
jgi:hypothetical protein